MQSCIDCNYLTSPHGAFSNVSSNCLPENRHSHIGCICLTFPTVRFQMCFQNVCTRCCIITLVAFIWPFSSVCFSMSVQSACIQSQLLHLFYVSPLCIIIKQDKLWSYHDLFLVNPVTVLQHFLWKLCNFPNNFVSSTSMQSHIGRNCLTFLHCAFLNVSSNCLPEKRHSHTDYICLAFLHCVSVQRACIIGNSVTLV